MIGRAARQMALLSYIHGYLLAKDGVSPNYRECAAAIGLRSISRIGFMLDALEQRGHIRRLRFKDRAIEVLLPPVIPMIGSTPLYAVPLPHLCAGGKD